MPYIYAWHKSLANGLKSIEYNLFLVDEILFRKLLFFYSIRGRSLYAENFKYSKAFP